MLSILTAILLTAAPEPVALRIAEPKAAETIVELPTGSLLFSQGDCLAVRVYTTSPYTHVAAIVERDGECYVYDSTGGTGVRKLPFSQYLVSQKEATVCVYVPTSPLSQTQRVRFEEHLESQLGRPYAIRHHLTGERSTGLHCAEYVMDALVAGELLQAEQPARVSPASLKEGIEQTGLYRQVGTWKLQPESAESPEDSGWCDRMWFETKSCTQTCYRKLRGWFCCK